ncbi:hypothetical protein CISIN_1g031193mg [Citrus sinensis]|uniref:DUF7781 domain-containing protein n=1 Tax=Citrus sinensis TaxID=2711 RepID=A0A067GEP2_CITSI|nr:hypothetical protein CISIN_1g031193mg [Citrus sinensis]
MEAGSNGEEPTSWDELYSINLMPSELFLKFRKEIEGFRVGVNLEFYNAPVNEYQAKIILKPLSPNRPWKFIYEPIHQDVRILSKKIPVTKFLNLQVGIGHNFQLHATGWKWKLTTCLVEMEYPGSGIRHLWACVLGWIFDLVGGQIMFFQRLLGLWVLVNRCST